LVDLANFEGIAFWLKALEKDSPNVKLNPDSAFTACFGSSELCGDVPNRLDVTDGWNFLRRIHSGPSVLDGAYQLPGVTAVKCRGVPSGHHSFAPNDEAF
jgi:hypothetical protein